MLLDERFAATAARLPDAVAVEVPAGGAGAPRSRTYRELWADALRLADALGGRVAPDARIVILLAREQPALYAAQLAANRVGGAFLCLDPRFPDEHLHAVVTNAGPVAAITDAAGAERLMSRGRPGNMRVIVVDPEGAGAPELQRSESSTPIDAVDVDRPADHPHPPRSDRDLAYVIYTSGTTGAPKGVMIEHRSIDRLVAGNVAYFGLGPGARVAQLSSPAYDSSIEETWLAFAVGATLVPMDDETVRLGPDLAPWLRRQAINVLCPPPTLLRAMGEVDPRAEVPDLRLLYVGGEALTPDVASRWARGPRMVNGYGPTECSVVVMRAEVAPDQPVTIGRAVPGSRAHVLDEEGRATPPGEEGELCIAGDSLARGYLGRPALTEERFPTLPGLGRIYRTGDRVVREESGDHVFLGRIDGQVKLRGYRVELGAVEASLAALDGVRAAACRVQGTGGAQRLAAHLVLADPATGLNVAAHRATLEARLPAYMVPTLWRTAERLPTGIGGKLDRRRLPDIDPHSAVGPELSDPPRGTLEHTLAAAFAAALDLPSDSLNRDADFFTDLGGDSLSAVGVITRLRVEPAPGMTVPSVRDLYAAPTIAGLASRQAALMRAAPDDDRATVGHAPSLPVATTEGGTPIDDVAPTTDAATIPDRSSIAAAGATTDRVATAERVAISDPVSTADRVANTHQASTTVLAPTADRATPARRAAATTAVATTTIATSTGSAATPAHAPFAGRLLRVVRGAPSAVDADADAGRPDDAQVRRSTATQGAIVAAAVAVGGGVAWWLITTIATAVPTTWNPGLILLALWLLAPLASVLGLVLSVLWAVAMKRVLVGRYEPGVIPMWSPHYLRHWLVARSAAAIPWGLLAGTELAPFVLRLLGARVGRGVFVHRGAALGGGAWDLLELGDGAVLGRDAAPRTVELRDGCLVLAPVVLGKGAVLETRAGLAPGASMGEGATLTALSWLPGDAAIPSGERWDGVPARPVERVATTAAPPPNHPWRHAALLLGARLLVGEIIALSVLAPLLVASFIVPDASAAVLAWIASPRLGVAWVLAATVYAAFALVTSLLLRAALIRGMGRMEPGRYGLWSTAAIPIWLKMEQLERAGRWLSGSLAWPPWLRLAGMRIGRGCEISTIIDVVPETVHIGEESFFADGVYLAGPRIDRGVVELRATTIGARTFLANHCYVPSGERWPDDLFIAVSTVADADLVRPDSAWFGHPPFALPRREQVSADRRLTHEPQLARRLTRLIFEGLRVVLPGPPLLVLALWFVLASAAAQRMSAMALYGLALPVLSLAALAVPCLAILALKWGLLGRVRPGQHAFWSCWCARWDFLYVAWDIWARAVLQAIDGTLLLNAYLRLTGMDIGKRVALGGGFVQVVDPDMLHFGDGSTVDCQFQAHSFEDRVLKIDHLRIARGATVGPSTVVFYGAHVGQGTVVEPHGIVMKHEHLPAGRRYVGNPCREAPRDR